MKRTIPPQIQEALARHDLGLCLLVQSGSKAYGISVEGSDDDYVGVFVPSLEKFLSLRGFGPETHAANDPDFTLHEIGKFCRLALKGNPAILETLWNPDLVSLSPIGEKLVGLRRSFLHRGSLDVYVEYARSQLKKMVRGKGLHAKGGAYNGKYGAHLIRLLHSGLDLAQTGEVTVRVAPKLASTLLDIRKGKHTMEDVLSMAQPLLKKLAGLTGENSLPARADLDRVQALVLEARRSRGA
ncbi:MAG TPA: nucleotidyltransferase domain-containing protein [Planctomycetota bacterium]|nr:nucleotidyltransferase domain-containing protein [Planctomycetota bacterium]